MSTISGRVVSKESGQGIPDLLVVLTDLDPGTSEADYAGASEYEKGGGPLAGARIDSGLTNGNGEFSLAFDEPQFRGRHSGGLRPDFQVAGLAPAVREGDPEAQALADSIRLGYEAEAENPDIAFAPRPDEEVQWLAGWLVSEGWTRSPDWPHDKA